MAGKIRYLLQRDGRYYARKIVPSELRAIVGTNDLRKPLGPDRRTAINSLPLALVSLDARIDHARRILAAQQNSRDAHAKVLAAPMSHDQLARVHYQERLALDEVLRNSNPVWAQTGIDDSYVADLRAASAGKLADADMENLLGDILQKYRLRGNISSEPGAQEWRQQARSIADAELEVLGRMYERDDGNFIPREEHPARLSIVTTAVIDEPFVEPLSLRGLLQAYLLELESAGRGRSARKGWQPVFEDLVVHVRKLRGLSEKAGIQADDAHLLTKQEVADWRDTKLKTLAPRTVKDVWLASLKAVLNRAVENDKLEKNVAAEVKVRVVAKARNREQGFTALEATAILKMCNGYSPTKRDNPANQESVHIAAAKKWDPWLCAFTGARIGEILQLRRSDVWKEGEIFVARITSDAGTVKTRTFRDVPLHPQLAELGFFEFIAATADGPLFYSPTADVADLPGQAVATRVAKWLQGSGLVPDGVRPNHGWLHRFKTVGRELGVDSRILDAIQGHASLTAGDRYGDVTLAAKSAAILKFPHYELAHSQ